MRSDKPKILAALKAHARTKNYNGIAEMLGVSPATVYYVGSLVGFKKPYVQMSCRSKHDRMRKYFQAHARTQSMKQMGRAMGVSGERARQLCNQWQIDFRRRPPSRLEPLSDRELRKAVRPPMKSFKAMARELGVMERKLA